MKTNPLVTKTRAARRGGSATGVWTACWLLLLPGCAHNAASNGQRPVPPRQAPSGMTRDTDVGFETPAGQAAQAPSDYSRWIELFATNPRPAGTGCANTTSEQSRWNTFFASMTPTAPAGSASSTRDELSSWNDFFAGRNNR